jgi:transposase
MKRHELTDEQWALVEPHLPMSAARTGRPPCDRRTQLNGIFWILSTGAPWRDLPERFGPWQTVYDPFRNWRKSGVFAAIIEALQVKLDKNGYIDWELWCVDGSVVRAARAAAGADKKVSGGISTNPPTTHVEGKPFTWAARVAGLDRNSTLSLTVRELPLPSKLRPGKSTNRRGLSRSSGRPSRC